MQAWASRGGDRKLLDKPRWRLLPAVVAPGAIRGPMAKEFMNDGKNLVIYCGMRERCGGPVRGATDTTSTKHKTLAIGATMLCDRQEVGGGELTCEERRAEAECASYHQHKQTRRGNDEMR